MDQLPPPLVRIFFEYLLDDNSKPRYCVDYKEYFDDMAEILNLQKFDHKMMVTTFSCLHRDFPIDEFIPSNAEIIIDYNPLQCSFSNYSKLRSIQIDNISHGIKNKLPTKIEEVILYLYDPTIHYFDNLRRLTICKEYPYNINFSNKLEYLSISLLDKYELKKGILPDSLQTFCLTFDGDLKNIHIPNSVKKLNLNVSDKLKCTSEMFPKDLCQLEIFYYNSNNINLDTLPNYVNTLKIINAVINRDDKMFSRFENLTKLRLGTLPMPGNLSGLKLPQSLKILILGVHYWDDLNIDILPNNLRILVATSDVITFSPDCKFPSTLEELICHSNVPSLPKNLKRLSFESTDYLPKLFEGLEILELHDCKKVQLEPGYIPQSVKILVLRNYVKKLMPNIFPKNLLHLDIRNYKKNIRAGVLPKTLRKLVLSKDYIYKDHLKKYYKGKIIYV